MAHPWIAVLGIIVVALTVSAGQWVSISLATKLSDPQEYNQQFNNSWYGHKIEFSQYAFKRFQSCLSQPDYYSCCTRLRQHYNVKGQYIAQPTFKCGSSRNRSQIMDSDIYQCYANVGSNKNVNIIVCKRISQNDTSGLKTHNRWFSFSDKNETCVSVRLQETQRILYIDGQNNTVNLRIGLCMSGTSSTLLTLSSPSSSQTPSLSSSSATTTRSLSLTTTIFSSILMTRSTSYKTVTSRKTLKTTDFDVTIDELSQQTKSDDSQNKDNTFLIVVCTVVGVIGLLIIVIVLAMIIWRLRRKHQTRPISTPHGDICRPGQALLQNYTEVNYEHVGEIPQNGTGASSGDKPENKTATTQKESNTVGGTCVSAEEIIRNKRAATGGLTVASERGKGSPNGNANISETEGVTPSPSSNTQSCPYDAQSDYTSTTQQDAISAEGNVYSRLGDQVRVFENPYDDMTTLRENLAKTSGTGEDTSV